MRQERVGLRSFEAASIARRERGLGRMSADAEERAVAYVSHRAERLSSAAHSTIARLLAQHGGARGLVRRIVETVAEHARVTLNFHPDRPRRDGRTVAEGLLHDGFYRSQYDTGVTNGSPTAFPGGERNRWEKQLFGDAYDGAVVCGTAPERPKYGAFNVMAHTDGGSPRFGSCYFELSPSMLARCTFTWGDSHERPEHVGTIAHFEPVLAALFEQVSKTGSALGVTGLQLSALIQRLTSLERLQGTFASRSPGRALDAYIEAQVHGAIHLAGDVEALIIDPAFDDTETGQHLAAIAARYGIVLRRHAGFILHAAEIPSDFRGPRMRPLAERISETGELDAATLGRAAQSLMREPARWQDWGTEAETWQHLKQLWHVLVRFGRGRAEPAFRHL